MTVRKQVDRDRVESHEVWKTVPEDEQAWLIELIENGSSTQAVKHFRAVTGQGLAASQAAIDEVTGGGPHPRAGGSSAPIPLSGETDRRLRLVFDPKLWDEATRMLEGLAGPDFGNTPEELERLRFAALKTSEGTLPGLQEATDLARMDWRDLLMAAGFGHDTAANERWLNRGKWWEFWK